MNDHTEPQTAIAYLRVSTREQGKSGLGIEAQREDIRRFCLANHIAVLEWVEEWESGKGHDALERRPKLAYALKAAKKARAYIVTAKIDRLARDAAFGTSLLVRGVKFLSADCGMHADNFYIQIRFVIAEEERNRIAQRTRDALQALKRKGKKLGNRKGFKEALKLGRDVQRRNADTFALETVSLIRGYQQAGHSLRQIADLMNKRHIPTARKTLWYAPTVYHVLKRAKSLQQQNVV